MTSLDAQGPGPEGPAGPTGAAAVRDAVVAGVITKVAPEELPLVEALRGLDDRAVLDRLTTRARRSEPLGFGVETVGVLLTPVVWIAVDESVRRVVDGAVERTGKAKLLRRLPFGRRRLPAPPSVPPLTGEQLALVEKCVLEATQQARLSAERGERIADGVVRRLVLLRQASEQGGGPAEGSATGSAEEGS